MVKVMVTGGVLQVELKVDKTLVDAAYRRALRTGKYFKLPPQERAALYLARKLTWIKSQTLKEVLKKIILKVWPSLAWRMKALEVGFKLLEKRVETALKIGYTRAREWLKNTEYAFYLGVSWLNTSPILRPPLD